MRNILGSCFIRLLQLKRPLVVCIAGFVSSMSYAECTEEDLAQRKADLQAYLLEITTLDADTLEQLPSFSYALACEQPDESQAYTVQAETVDVLEQVGGSGERRQLLEDQAALLSEELSAALGDGSTQGVDIPQLQSMFNNYVESSNRDMEALKQQANNLGVSSELVNRMLENMTAHEKWEDLLLKR